MYTHYQPREHDKFCITKCGETAGDSRGQERKNNTRAAMVSSRTDRGENASPDHRRDTHESEILYAQYFPELVFMRVAQPTSASLTAICI